MKRLKTQVCIVGSGVAGALCAKYLTPHVQDILVIERGAAVPHSWSLETRRHERPIPTAHHSFEVQSPAALNVMFCYSLGGTTNQWMGQAPRLAPCDFKMKSLYGIMEDWPVSYEELEPYYCLADDELSVAGASDNRLIPRSRPYPQPPHPFSPVDELLRCCFPSGSIVASPQARPTQDVGSRPACCGSNTCYLCPVDSKYTTLNTHIPQLQAESKTRILTDTVVLSCQTNGNRKITALHAKQGLGEEVSIEADLLILAANALENAAILLRSEKVPIHPNVGKFFFDHPIFKVVTKISREGWANYGTSKWTSHCYEFYDGPFRSERSGALGEIFNEAGIDPTDLVIPAAVGKRLRGEVLRQEIEYESRHHITMEFLLEEFPEKDRLVRLGTKKDALGIPVSEIHYTATTEYARKTRAEIESLLPKYLEPLGVRELIVEPIRHGIGHLLGTCKMGHDGVVDATLRYRDLDNLYILGGSAFPTYSPSNPTMTIAALAIRLADHLKSWTA